MKYLKPLDRLYTFEDEYHKIITACGKEMLKLIPEIYNTKTPLWFWAK